RDHVERAGGEELDRAGLQGGDAGGRGERDELDLDALLGEVAGGVGQVDRDVEDVAADPDGDRGGAVGVGRGGPGRADAAGQGGAEQCDGGEPGGAPCSP